MSENMDKFRHMDGSEAIVDKPFIRIVFQHGHPKDIGINGCRVEDVIDVAAEKLLDFQGRDLCCSENAEALEHLHLAREALLRRRRMRQDQDVYGTQMPHVSKQATADLS